MLIPLTHYLNSEKSVAIKRGQKFMYQNVNHPANSPKRPVTFRQYTNTGYALEEFPGTVYSGNLWIEIDDSSGIHTNNIMIDHLSHKG